MQVIGLKRTIMLLLAVLMAGTGLSTFMTDPGVMHAAHGRTLVSHPGAAATPDPEQKHDPVCGLDKHGGRLGDRAIWG
jgi:hypothetical protein